MRLIRPCMPVPSFLCLQLAVVVVAMGCRGPQNSSEAPSSTAGSSAETELSIAVIPKQTGGEFWETVELGAKQAAEELGVAVHWEGTLTETEIAEQNKIIENMINLRVDGMAIAPLNARATRKAVQNSVDADIPVVIFDSGIEGDSHVSFVATDNKAGGALAGSYIAEQLQGHGRVIVNRFLQGTGSTEARVEGFIETMRSSGIEVAAEPYSEDGTVAGAKKTSANVLERFVKDQTLQVDGIFSCNLYTALGMAAALNDLRKSGVKVDTIFVGFDTSPKLLDGLRNESIHALIAQNPHRMGRLALETLVQHLRGESIASRIDTGAELVTLDRLRDNKDLRELVGWE